MLDGSSETEKLYRHVDLVNDTSIADRFGETIFESGPKFRRTLLPIARINSAVVAEDNVPDKKDHRCGWQLSWQEDGTHKPEIKIVLKDWIEVGSLFPNIQKRGEFRQILRNGWTEDWSDVINHVFSKTEEQSGLEKEIEKMPGWKVEFCYEAPFDTFSSGHSLRIYNETGTEVNVSVAYKPSFEYEVKIPLVGGFEKNQENCRRMVSHLSNIFGLRYNPVLKYKFAFDKDIKIANIAAQESTSYSEYFSRCLKNWETLVGEKDDIRTVIGKDRNGKYILLLEDNTLCVNTFELPGNLYNCDAVYRERVGDRVYLNLGSINQGVGGHDVIFTSFQEAIDRRTVNPKLAEDFPARWSNPRWLHAFVQIQHDGSALFKRDFGETEDITELELAKLVEEYGLTESGQTPFEISERRAKEVMFIPLILQQAALLKKKYGGDSASKFRGYATSFLINGDVNAQEKYEAYLKLIKTIN